MKKLILLICMLAGMSSCYHEDALIVPEQPDKYNILTDDPSDPTQHFIYQFYQKYQTVIITNPTEADYKFNFTANNGIKITAPEQKQEIIDEGIEFLQKVLLNLYSDSFLKKNLPFSILLSEEVRMASYGETTIMNCYASSSFIALGNVSSSLKTMTDEEFVKIRADVNASFWAKYMSEVRGLFTISDAFYETHMKEDFRYTGNLVVSDDLLALYSEDDLRLTNYFKNTIGNQTRPTNKQYSVYTPIKWTKNSATVYANALRISEAYLNRAEAFAELGNTNKALADLNELRENRMKPGTPPLAVDEDGIVATVRKERRRELAFEGFRWFDLRRYGCPPLTHTYSSKENEGAGDVFELKEKGSYVLPIPKSERERNTEIEIFDRPNSEPVNN